MRPLYEAAVRSPHRRHDGHAGLWFDKFCNQWLQKNGKWTMKNDHDSTDSPKLRWIQEFTGVPIGARDQIDEYALRMARLVEKRNGRWFAFTTSSRFVTGLGRSHPVENGFAWHSTLGTPYLPGSSIKGLVHAWATLDEHRHGSADNLAGLIGSPKSVGRITFMDAVPVKPVVLEADVMTPHYAGWTTDKYGWPGDWRSPTPIPFLVTADNTPFLFAIVPTRIDPERNPEADVEIVSGWLRRALALAGAGAKTAIGYGRFECDSDTQDELRRGLCARQQKIETDLRQAWEAHEREMRLARMSPVEREIEELIAGRPNRTEPAFIFILGHLQRDRWAGDAKIEVAGWLATKMKRESRWKDQSGAKNPAKDRDYQRTQLVKRWRSGE